MSAASKLRLGTPMYRHDNPTKIAIYNANYDQHGRKVMGRVNPWRAHQGFTVLGNIGFPTHEAASDFVREYLANGQVVS